MTSNHWDRFIGQERLKSELFSIIAGRKKYGLPNLILAGPYGCGKTTLALLFGDAIGHTYYLSRGDSQKALAIDPRYFNYNGLIIDEIHLVRRWERLYPVLDSRICLIGATTMPGKIDHPFLSRCTLLKFDEYSYDDLLQIATNTAKQVGNGNVPLEPIIQRARGTPRLAVNLTIRLLRFLSYHKIKPTLTNIEGVLQEAFKIEPNGLTADDRTYLWVLEKAERPVGLRTIQIATGFGREYIEETIEPYLLQLGLITHTSQGRTLGKMFYG